MVPGRACQADLQASVQTSRKSPNAPSMDGLEDADALLFLSLVTGIHEDILFSRAVS